jgi:hypothetical protein
MMGSSASLQGHSQSISFGCCTRTSLSLSLSSHLVLFFFLPPLLFLFLPLSHSSRLPLSLPVARPVAPNLILLLSVPKAKYMWLDSFKSYLLFVFHFLSDRSSLDVARQRSLEFKYQ